MSDKQDNDKVVLTGPVSTREAFMCTDSAFRVTVDGETIPGVPAGKYIVSYEYSENQPEYKMIFRKVQEGEQ